MNQTEEAKALFVMRDGQVVPDYLVCDRCPVNCSVGGRIPDLVQVGEGDSLDKGKPGDLIPSCAKSNLSSLGHWQGHNGSVFPENLLDLRLFKCRAWFWLVVPGLNDNNPGVVS